MSRDPAIILEDMMAEIDAIMRATENVEFEAFRDDWMLRRAVERGVEIVSEASRRLPGELKARRPDIAWSKVKAIGNVFRHEYDRVSSKILWDLVRGDLEPLRAALDALLHKPNLP